MDFKVEAMQLSRSPPLPGNRKVVSRPHGARRRFFDLPLPLRICIALTFAFRKAGHALSPDGRLRKASLAVVQTTLVILLLLACICVMLVPLMLVAHLGLLISDQLLSIAQNLLVAALCVLGALAIFGVILLGWRMFKAGSPR